MRFKLPVQGVKLKHCFCTTSDFRSPQSTLFRPLLVSRIHNIFGNFRESEKREGMFGAYRSPLNINDVAGIVCQLVLKSISDGMIQLL